MAQIRINEISQNYAYSVGSASFATVALPITSAWGPGYIAATADEAPGVIAERTAWTRFPATREGLESFVAAYRGPASNYRIAEDYSYYQAMTLLSAGYDILVCRMCSGQQAQLMICFQPALGAGQNHYLYVKAKYPGTFGNNMLVSFKHVASKNCWNLVVYIKDTTTGVTTAVENLVFYFDKTNPKPNVPHLSEVESQFVELAVTDDFKVDDDKRSNYAIKYGPGSQLTFTDSTKAPLAGGTDYLTNWGQTVDGEYVASLNLYRAVYGANAAIQEEASDYVAGMQLMYNDEGSRTYWEWIHYHVMYAYDILKDKLTYNPNRIISPGWCTLAPVLREYSTLGTKLTAPSLLHCKLMEVAYSSRCACAYLDVPKELARDQVYNESTTAGQAGYAQLLSRTQDHPNYGMLSVDSDFNEFLYPTNAALFAPWGQYRYVGMSKMCPASPSFLALMIERAMIKNQSAQYEWIMPTVRRHKLNIGKLDYTVSKHLLDIWQKLEGVGVNVITDIPDMGVSIWGNSTLFETPPATYQALANLSTRKLMNAVKDIAYKCGLAITFQYNNNQAYAAFYAGVTPTLDNMKNVGAIEGYKISMAADINGVDHVNANTVIGVITLYVNGVINDINIDLIAMPAGAGLE